MKKVIFIMLAALTLVVGCKKDGNESGETTPLNVNFSVTPEVVSAGDAVTFEAQVSGGKAPYSYQWTISGTVQEKTTASLVYTFAQNGSAVIILDVKDSKGNTAQKKKAIVVNAPKIEETGNLTVHWAGKMTGYNAKSSVAIADDGSVYSTTQDSKLYKWSSSGESVWIKEIVSGSKTLGTPSIDTDGTLFISGGNSDGLGVLKAFNPDGSVKWSFSEWWRADGDTPAPTCLGTIAAIDENNIYFGCTGTNGIVFSADKARGKRNGFMAPAGGARSGIVISKSNFIHWYGGKYGAFGMSIPSLNGGGNDKLNPTWRKWGSGDDPTYEGQIGCMTIGGEVCMIGVVTDTQGTKVYALKSSDGSEVCVKYIEDTNQQDQGGVSVDLNGNIVASLSNTAGKDNGGIVIVNPVSGEIVARYRTQEKVSGTPAIDAAGNIHFGTESGFYYVVKLNGDKCDLLVKRSIASLVVSDSRYAGVFTMSGKQLASAKIWSSPVIGDDGKIYICFTDNESRAYGGVICLGYEGCTGPGNSEWPMVGHDRRHTCKQ